MSASTSLQGPSNPSFEFLEGIKNGNLEETLKKYPLQEESNLVALEQFILKNQEITSDQLLDLIDTVSTMHLEKALMHKVNNVVGRRLVNFSRQNLSLEGLKARIERQIRNPDPLLNLTDRIGIIENELMAIGFETIMNRLVSDDDKKWFAELIRKNIGHNNRQLFVSELMAINPTFVMNYLPDLLIYSCAEVMNISLDFDTRTEIAQRAIQIDPNILSVRLNALFTMMEIRDNLPKFIPLINSLEAKIRDNQAKLYASHQIFTAQSLENQLQQLNTLREILILRPFTTEAQPNFEQRLLAAQDRCDREKCDSVAVFQQNLSTEVFELLKTFTAEEINANLSDMTPLLSHIAQNLDPERPESQKAIEYLEKQKFYLKYLREGSVENDKDCHHWHCLGEFPEDSGCYVFKLKEQYAPRIGSALGDKTASNENIKIFPAVEPTHSTSLLTEQLVNSSPHGIIPLLGLKYEPGPNGFYFTIPDAKTLNTRWAELRIDPKYAHLQLPEFSCGESDGIATAEDFMDLLDQHDIVISKNKEFFHDMTIHGLATLVAILENPKDYPEVRAQMREVRANATRVLAKQQDEQVITTLIPHIVAIFYDICTGSQNLHLRTQLIKGWDNGTIFDLIHEFGGGWIPNLWQNPDLHESLQAVGVKSEYAELPVKVLEKAWLKFRGQVGFKNEREAVVKK